MSGCLLLRGGIAVSFARECRGPTRMRFACSALYKSMALLVWTASEHFVSPQPNDLFVTNTTTKYFRMRA